MPAPSAVTSRIDVELPEWLVVPRPEDVTAEWRSEVETLFGVIAEIDRGSEEPDADADADADPDTALFGVYRPIDPASTIDDLLAFSAALDPGQRLVVGLGVPNRWPLPVVVSVGIAGDDSPDLLTLAGATGGLPTDPPAVDELPEHLGGEGPLVTRYDIDDGGAIWATVCGIRRQDGVDTSVLWRTRELEVVPVFTPAVVALIGHVVNEAAVTEPTETVPAETVPAETEAAA